MAHRKRRRRRRINRKKKIIRAYLARAIFLLLIIGLVALAAFLIGRIKKLSSPDNEGEDETVSENTEVSTIAISNRGVITETTVDSFNTEEYDKDGLKAMAEEAIKSYNSADGKDGAVSLKDIAFRRGKCSMVLSFKTAEDYVGFYGDGRTFMLGKVEELMEKDAQDFTGLIKVKDEEALTTEDMKKLNGSAVIINEDKIVKTPGAIRVISPSVSMNSAKEATVHKGRRPVVLVY